MIKQSKMLSFLLLLGFMQNMLMRAEPTTEIIADVPDA